MGAAPQLPISNVITVSVSLGNVGVNEPNTGNLCVFSSETPGTSFPAAGYGIYQTPAAVAADWGTSSITYKMANTVFSQQPNILAPGGSLIVVPFIPSETLSAAITRAQGLVNFFGCMSTQIEDQADTLAAAAVTQALNLILFIVQYSSATIAPGGTLDLLRTGGFTQTRGLYYGDSSGSPAGINALLMMAAYASRGMSVDFDGSDTTITMALKTLVGIQPDPTASQTLYNEALAAGADVYMSIDGDPVVGCFGANNFFDQVDNRIWFATALQIAAFNYLAQVDTKIAQTEAGMDGYKAALAAVCQQGVTNQYIAPGVWTSPTTFGNPASLISNIADVGYYLYSVPIAQQSVAARAARSAPPVSIAIKEAGAIQNGSIVIFVNP
jgi:hypothetical protein